MADGLSALAEQLRAIDIELSGLVVQDERWYAALVRREAVASRVAKASRAAGTSSSRVSQPALSGPVDGEDAARLAASTHRLASRGGSLLRASALTPSGIGAVSGPPQPPFLARVNHVAVVHGESGEGCARLVGGLDGVTAALALSSSAGPDALVLACSPPLPASFARAPSVVASSHPSGPALLAILCAEGLAVVLVPEHCWEGGAEGVAPLPSLIVAPELLAIARPVDAKWHPLSPRHLCVLCADGLRTFVVEVDGVGALTAVLVDEVGLPPGDAPPAAFAFGTARGWELLSVVIASGDGRVDTLCPLLPPGALLPASDWADLLADADAAAAAEFSVMAGPVAPAAAAAALENGASARRAGEWLRGSFADAPADAQYKRLTSAGGARWQPALQPCVWAGGGGGKPGPVTAGAAACDVAVLPPSSPRAALPALLLLFLDGSLLGLLGSSPVRPVFQGGRHEVAAWVVLAAVQVGHLGHPLAQARAAVAAGGSTFAGGAPGEGLGTSGGRETLHVPRLVPHWQARAGAPPGLPAVALVGRHSAVDVTLAFAMGVGRLGDALAAGGADLPAAVAAVGQAGVRVHELVGEGGEDILGLSVGRAGALCWLEGTGRPPRAVPTGAGGAWAEGGVPCTLRGTFLSLPLAASTALLLLALSDAAGGGREGEGDTLAAFARVPALATLVDELRTGRPEPPPPSAYPSEPTVVGSVTEASLDAWVGDVVGLEADARALAEGRRATTDRVATLRASIQPQLQALYARLDAGAATLGSANAGTAARLARVEATAALLQSRAALASLSLQLASPAGLSREEVAAHAELTALLRQGRGLETLWQPAGGAGGGREARRVAAVLAAQGVAVDRARPTAAAMTAVENAEASLEASRGVRLHVSAELAVHKRTLLEAS